MADGESGNAGTGGDRSKSVGFNTDFIRTPPGVLMIVNIVILFICWCIVAGWRNSVFAVFSAYYDAETSFYLSTAVIPFVIFIVLFVLMLFGIHAKLSFINFPLTILLNCCIWAVMLLISSSTIANVARVSRSENQCIVMKCEGLEAATVCGFLGVIGMGVEGFFHFREWRSA